MSPIWPYEYRTVSGVIEVYPLGTAAELQTSNGNRIALPASEFGGFIAALYAAAGLPEPVILERPEAPVLDLIPGLRFTANGGVIEAERPGGNWQVDPAKIRQLAASLAVLADEAEASPDPAEVRELALVLRRYTPGMAYPTEGDYGLAVATGYAEAALRWFRDRQQRGEAP